MLFTLLKNRDVKKDEHHGYPLQAGLLNCRSGFGGTFQIRSRNWGLWRRGFDGYKKECSVKRQRKVCLSAEKGREHSGDREKLESWVDQEGGRRKRPIIQQRRRGRRKIQLRM